MLQKALTVTGEKLRAGAACLSLGRMEKSNTQSLKLPANESAK